MSNQDQNNHQEQPAAQNHEDNTPDDLITIAGAAKLADKKDPTIRNWIKEGKLREFTCDNVKHVSRSELEQFIPPSRMEELRDIQNIRISDLLLDNTDTQMRERLNTEAVEEYAEKLREDPSSLPPVSVCTATEGKFFLVDGWHRITAAQSCGLTDFRAEIVGKGKEEAITHALRANSKNSVQLTNADKQKKVIFALHRYGQEESNSKIAARCCVSEGMVRQHRNHAGIQAPDKVVGRDEKRYPAKREKRNGAMSSVQMARTNPASQPEPAQPSVNKVTKGLSMLSKDELLAVKAEIERLLEQLDAKHTAEPQSQSGTSDEEESSQLSYDSQHEEGEVPRPLPTV